MILHNGTRESWHLCYFHDRLDLDFCSFEDMGWDKQDQQQNPWFKDSVVLEFSSRIHMTNIFHSKMGSRSHIRSYHTHDSHSHSHSCRHGQAHCSLSPQSSCCTRSWCEGGRGRYFPEFEYHYLHKVFYISLVVGVGSHRQCGPYYKLFCINYEQHQQQNSPGSLISLSRVRPS